MQGYRAYRRLLPHYEHDDRTYFVTFCTLKREVLFPSARDIILREIAAQHTTAIDLRTAVVMPDHVHIVFAPLTDRFGFTHALADVMQRLKGRSARLVNLAVGRKGPLWQREYFDRQLRSDEDWRKKCEYVAMNPVRRGIVASPDEYRWLWRVWIDGAPALAGEGTKDTG